MIASSFIPADFSSVSLNIELSVEDMECKNPTIRLYINNNELTNVFWSMSKYNVLTTFDIELIKGKIQATQRQMSDVQITTEKSWCRKMELF